MSTRSSLSLSRQTGQQLVYGLLGAVVVGVFALWLTSSLDLLLSSPGGALIALGRLAGLSAAVCALIQFMLMGRIGWIEGPFGLDRIAPFHRLNGYATITLILIHPLLLTSGYALNAGVSYIAQYLTFITSFTYVWLALIAQLLFILVVVFSVYIVRKRLKFETWYWVHLLVYAAIILVFAHQIYVGGTFVSNPVARTLWEGLYAFVGLNVLYWRFGKILIGYLRHGFKVDEVVHETPTAASVYIRGRNFERWKSKPGQFVLVRFLTKQLFLEEHPFSLSYIPKDGRLRLTIKNIGDYTALIQALKPGAKVLVSGPFGSFTHELTTNPKKLYVAGGVGITPLRAMIEEDGPGADIRLIYGNKTQDDTLLMGELRKLMPPSSINLVMSNEPAFKGAKGYVNAELIAATVPDFASRDIYLCGPPPMMQGVETGLLAKGFPAHQLHYERFSLHR